MVGLLMLCYTFIHPYQVNSGELRQAKSHLIVASVEAQKTLVTTNQGWSAQAWVWSGARDHSPRSAEPDGDNGHEQMQLCGPAAPPSRSFPPAGQTGPKLRKHDRVPYPRQSASGVTAFSSGLQTRCRFPQKPIAP